MTSRRDFLKLAAATTSAVCLGSCKLSSAFDSGKKPNVVFLFADDLGYADLGCTGSDLHLTPNIDKFASQSMRFSNAYTSHCTCAPSRLGYMTGKYPARLGVINNHVGEALRGNYTLAQAMKDIGYSTCHLGKWHIGNEDLRPELKGYDEAIGSNKAGQPAGYFYPFGKNKKSSKKVPGLEEDFSKGDHLTACLTDKAIEYIKEHKDGPFFMSFCYYAVHTPIQAEKEKIEKYKSLMKDGLRHDNPKYAALVEHLDDSVGRILETLDQQGIADNTIVIFFSDNGGAFVTDNYPLRSKKGTGYEGGDRVPMFVRWRGVTKAGDVCDEPVIGHDLYPTFVSMAGGKLNSKNKDIDGVNLTGLMKGTEKKLDRQLHWLCYPLKPHYGSHGVRFPFGSIRDGDFKLIQKFETLDGKQKGGYELYDLKNDIYEQENLVEKMPEKFKQLKKEMESWRKSVNAPVFDPHMYD